MENPKAPIRDSEVSLRTYRRRLLSVAGTTIACIWILLAVIVIVWMLLTPEQFRGVVVQAIAAAVIYAAVGVALLRTAITGIKTYPEGLRVINFWRSRRFGWSEVKEFQDKRWLIYPHVCHLKTRTGHILPIPSISGWSFFRGEWFTETMQELRGELDARGQKLSADSH
ncbi:MAG: hypothetical protein WD757_02700 [Actinomycetota bacterium]